MAGLRFEQQLLHPPAGELTDVQLVLRTAIDPVHSAEFLQKPAGAPEPADDTPCLKKLHRE